MQTNENIQILTEDITKLKGHIEQLNKSVLHQLNGLKGDVIKEDQKLQRQVTIALTQLEEHKASIDFLKNERIAIIEKANF